MKITKHIPAKVQKHLTVEKAFYCAGVSIGIAFFASVALDQFYKDERQEFCDARRSEIKQQIEQTDLVKMLEENVQGNGKISITIAYNPEAGEFPAPTLDIMRIRDCPNYGFYEEINLDQQQP